ncbi:MAG: hypothetical protein GY861_18250 [bacterium]|nr:hypothetical protein [bacterium]
MFNKDIFEEIKNDKIRDNIRESEIEDARIFTFNGQLSKESLEMLDTREEAEDRVADEIMNEQFKWGEEIEPELHEDWGERE